MNKIDELISELKKCVDLLEQAKKRSPLDEDEKEALRTMLKHLKKATKKRYKVIVIRTFFDPVLNWQRPYIALYENESLYYDSICGYYTWANKLELNKVYEIEDLLC